MRTWTGRAGVRAGNRFQSRSRACNRKLGEKLDDECGIRREALPDYLEKEREREREENKRRDFRRSMKIYKRKDFFFANGCVVCFPSAIATENRCSDFVERTNLATFSHVRARRMCARVSECVKLEARSLRNRVIRADTRLRKVRRTRTGSARCHSSRFIAPGLSKSITILRTRCPISRRHRRRRATGVSVEF